MFIFLSSIETNSDFTFFLSKVFLVRNIICVLVEYGSDLKRSDEQGRDRDTSSTSSSKYFF